MNRIFSVFSVLACGLMLSACGRQAAPKKDLASHVIIIGLDGWGTWCMEKGDYPFIKEKMLEGSWTLEKRTVLPSSSGPNWGAMMNGTPVAEILNLEVPQSWRGKAFDEVFE